jgi:hypothetical protein
MPSPPSEVEAVDEAATTQAELPEGWGSALSRSTGEMYYVNTLTAETTYDVPTAPATADAVAGQNQQQQQSWEDQGQINADGHEQQVQRQTQLRKQIRSPKLMRQRLARPKQSKAQRLQEQQQRETWTDDGRRSRTPSPSHNYTMSTLPPGWETGRSRSTGEVYYFNPWTGYSTYDIPTTPATQDQAPGVRRERRVRSPQASVRPSSATKVASHESPEVKAERQRRVKQLRQESTRRHIARQHLALYRRQEEASRSTIVQTPPRASHLVLHSQDKLRSLSPGSTEHSTEDVEHANGEGGNRLHLTTAPSTIDQWQAQVAMPEDAMSFTPTLSADITQLDDDRGAVVQKWQDLVQQQQLQAETAALQQRASEAEARALAEGRKAAAAQHEAQRSAQLAAHEATLRATAVSLTCPFLSPPTTLPFSKQILALSTSAFVFRQNSRRSEQWPPCRSFRKLPRPRLVCGKRWRHWRGRYWRPALIWRSRPRHSRHGPRRQHNVRTTSLLE